ncbi:SprT family zinc-dependent metalloprotease [Marinomonas sp. CT5]|uniref:SprT family zinc-dependent metalloprotease n=1 Tax=Marinomonas sp. CT5 TaxID=2066133 RepID=UPI001BAEDB46|nr:SprT family zinc-dependent metalloprotease [Marinomonas sp. CT5]QUX95923.1 SprT family zinc-dependent metalloprotease [Marinomonas sp. CT5]
MPLITPEMEFSNNQVALQLIQDKTQDCFDRADEFFATKFKRASCNFKQKGRAAGTAHLQKNELRFNHFMYQQDPIEFLETVVPHEVAHLIVFQIYGTTVRPHGKEWKAVMLKVYGLNPSRTHNFDVPKPKNVYQYHCSCKSHELSKLRHNKVQKGVEYICKDCRKILQLTI